MKVCLRTLAIISALLTLLVAGLLYFTSTQVRSAAADGGTAIAASLDTYRHAQALKAQAAGYELTMNEFYSTVLDFPAYMQKLGAQKKAIEQELAALSIADRDGKTVPELHRIYQDIDGFRQQLDNALSTTDKDWDRAREALFKINLLSVQAIQQADLLAQVSREQATALDKTWQNGLSLSAMQLQIATAIAGLTTLILLVGVLRPRTQTSGTTSA